MLVCINKQSRDIADECPCVNKHDLGVGTGDENIMFGLRKLQLETNSTTTVCELARPRDKESFAVVTELEKENLSS